ncbi:MAG: hypothetical protein R6U51_04635 [Anaerolineales bacterium]
MDVGLDAENLTGVQIRHQYNLYDKEFGPEMEINVADYAAHS